MESQSLVVAYADSSSTAEWNLYKASSTYRFQPESYTYEEILLIVPEAHFDLIRNGRLRLTMDHEGDFKLMSKEVCDEPVTEVVTFKNQDSTSVNFFPKDVMCFTSREPEDDELSGYNQISTSLLDEDANICSFAGGPNQITYSIEEKTITFSKKFSGRFYMTFKKQYFKLGLVVRSRRVSTTSERSSQMFMRTALSATADFINDEKTIFLEDVSDTDLHLYAESDDPEVDASAQLTLKSNSSGGSSHSTSSKDQKKEPEKAQPVVTYTSRFNATASILASNMTKFIPDVFTAKANDLQPAGAQMSVAGNSITIALYADSKLFDAPKRDVLMLSIPEEVADLGLKMIPMGERDFSKKFFIILDAKKTSSSPPSTKASDTPEPKDKNSNVSSNSECSSLLKSTEDSLNNAAPEAKSELLTFTAKVEWHVTIPDRFNNWYCKFIGPAVEVPYTLVKPIQNLAASTGVNDTTSISHFSEDMTQRSLGGAVATNTILVKENQFFGHRERLIVDGVEESTFSGEKKPLVVDGTEIYTDAEFNAMKTIATFGSGFSPGVSGAARVKDRVSLASGKQGHVQIDSDQDASIGDATTLSIVNHSGPNTQYSYNIQQTVLVQAFMPSRTKEDIPLEIKCVLEAGPGVKITSAGASDQQSATAKSSVAFNLPNGPAVIDEHEEDGGLGRMSANAQAGKAEYTIQTSTSHLVNGMFTVGVLSYSFLAGSYLVSDFHVGTTSYKTITHTDRHATLTLSEGLFSAEVSIKEPDWSKNLIVTDENGAVLPTDTVLPLPRTSTTADLTPTY